MSSQSWNAIPDARRKALAARLRAAEKRGGNSSDEDDDELFTVQEEIAKPNRTPSTEIDRKGSSGSKWSSGGSREKSPGNSSQEIDVDDDLMKQYNRKLERLETRLDRLVTLNENLVEKNQLLEDVIVKVAEHVGVHHSLGGSPGGSARR